MVRKYDRYGFNRQFKAKPCTRRYPFPYPLPFVDDFSAAAVIEKDISAPPEFTKGDIDTAYGGNKRSRANARHYIEESQRKRRATNAARKLAFEHPMSDMKKHMLTRRERRMNAAFYFATGAVLTGGLAGEIPAFSRALARAARVTRKARYVVERWNRRSNFHFHQD
jgi:hypothetical protein